MHVCSEVRTCLVGSGEAKFVYRLCAFDYVLTSYVIFHFILLSRCSYGIFIILTRDCRLRLARARLVRLRAVDYDIGMVGKFRCLLACFRHAVDVSQCTRWLLAVVLLLVVQQLVMMTFDW